MRAKAMRACQIPHRLIININQVLVIFDFPYGEAKSKKFLYIVS